MERQQDNNTAAAVAAAAWRDDGTWRDALARLRFVPSCPTLVETMRRDAGVVSDFGEREVKREGPRWSWES